MRSRISFTFALLLACVTALSSRLVLFFLFLHSRSELVALRVAPLSERASAFSLPFLGALPCGLDSLGRLSSSPLLSLFRSKSSTDGLTDPTSRRRLSSQPLLSTLLYFTAASSLFVLEGWQRQGREGILSILFPLLRFSLFCLC